MLWLHLSQLALLSWLDFALSAQLSQERLIEMETLQAQAEVDKRLIASLQVLTSLLSAPRSFHAPLRRAPGVAASSQLVSVDFGV
eukprot:6164782-Pleurochrysis_carterae.AAC.1